MSIHPVICLKKTGFCIFIWFPGNSGLKWDHFKYDIGSGWTGGTAGCAGGTAGCVGGAGGCMGGKVSTGGGWGAGSPPSAILIYV